MSDVSWERNAGIVVAMLLYANCSCVSAVNVARLAGSEPDIAQP